MKRSNTLSMDARLTAELTNRSMASQIEYWADLGRAVESMLHLDNVLALKKRATLKSLLEALRAVDKSAGRQHLKEVFDQEPFPHFEATPGRPGFLVRIEADGTRTTGRFVDRQFVTL